MKVTLAQLNPTIGDIEGNLKKVAETLLSSRDASPDLIVFPELFLVGYPPRDILEKSWFIEKVQQAITELQKLSLDYQKTGILIGAPLPQEQKDGWGLTNTALLILRGEILLKQAKSLLPSYDVFDEARYFAPAHEIFTVSFKGEILGISICEDVWSDAGLQSNHRYPIDPIALLAEKGATLMINISASPFHTGKEELRYQIIKRHAKNHQLPFIFVNQVGANDELIFDGRSLAVDKFGEVISVLPSFEESIQTIETHREGIKGLYKPQERIASVHNALVLGIRDYMSKCGFSKAVIGLSGGIDSSVTCCLAKEAIGENNVLGVAMPSPYSSDASCEDAKKLAQNLGISFKVISISAMYSAYIQSLEEQLDFGAEIDVTLQNIQARIRGNILMALSNKYGYLVLSTGNKSELAVGYCTLYGDMSGGLAVISDVPKTFVYELADHINEQKEIIPIAVIDKPPSAELKPDQVDEDTLPPYDVLDQILHYYIDQGSSHEDIVKMGYKPQVVIWVIEAVTKNEYKRRQAAPGLKVTTKAFGMGRRMAIAARYDI